MDTEGQPTPTQIMSPLAVVAVVLALIPLCVPINLAGVVLGMVARRRIAASGGTLRGHRTASTAIWGGIAMTVIGWWAWWQVTDWAEQLVRQSVSDTASAWVMAVQDGDTAAALALWAPSCDHPSEDGLARLKQALDGVGHIDAVGIRSMQPMSGGDALQPTWSAWLILNVGDRTLDGSGQFDVIPTQQGGALAAARIRRFTVSTPDGEIRLPASTDEAAP